jgi:hypothetical protein
MVGQEIHVKLWNLNRKWTNKIYQCNIKLKNHKFFPTEKVSMHLIVKQLIHIVLLFLKNWPYYDILKKSMFKWFGLWLWEFY